MAITLLEPLAAGNAVRIFIAPEPRAVFWRILRRTADLFTGADDVGAVVVADRSTDDCTLDLKALVNGTLYFYRCYSWDGAAWDAPASASVMPAATYRGDDIDPLQILRDRLAAGLAAEVARGALKPTTGAIPVLKSPFMLPDQIVFPTVFVHLDSFAPAERALGEEVLAPESLDEGEWEETEGFMARNALNIGAVSRMPDERNELRRALVRILQANFPVFAQAGLNLVEFNFADTEDLESKAAPLFMTGGSFSCVAMSFAGRRVPAISDVITHPQYTGMEPPNGR